MSRRRYKVGLNPCYDKRFDMQKGKSAILNQQRNDLSYTSLLADEPGLRQLLREWEGDRDGLFEDLKTGRVVPSNLKEAEDRLAAVGQKFENMKIMALRSGKHPPEEMPQELKDEQLELEARVDIVQEELDWLRKELAKYAAKKREADENLILIHGPAGTTHGADPPRKIDGQPIRWDEKLGNFLIDCKKSPYHGVTLPNYYAFIVKPWREAIRLAYEEADRASKNSEATEGTKRQWAEKAAMILRNPLQFVPMPERPSE